jgi:ApbE superfamily uncharacterized protein (UPF0280 family)
MHFDYNFVVAISANNAKACAAPARVASTQADAIATSVANLSGGAIDVASVVIACA